MVHDRLLDAAHLAQFKTLILPNIAALSDPQCQQIREFVERGGSIVATYETSLYDEFGRKRKNFGLANLFGADFKGRAEGPMHNAYLRLAHEYEHHRPLFKGLEDAPRIIHGVWRLDTQPTRPIEAAALTLIPSYPDLPMEKVFPRVARTEQPELYLTDLAPTGGRVVYFPWDIDRIFWEVLCVDHGKLLRNAVEWATNEEPPVVVTGPGVLDMTVWRQKNSMTVHLVNLTNPMMMKGPVRELIPVGEQRVRVRLPDGIRARRVRLLAADKSTRVLREGKDLSIVVPSIVDHEVVAIDL
jgi:hypothetical protein